MEADAVRHPPEIGYAAPDTPSGRDAGALFSARLLAWGDRHRYWLLIVVPLLYFAAFNGQWRVAPDSALYASLGRNLAEGHGYTYQGQRHNWVEPAFPLLIAAGFRLAGPDAFWPTLLVLTLLSFAALGLFYHLVLLHAGRPTAVVMTALLALNESFFRYAFNLFTDTPFLVGVLLLLLGYERIYQNVRSRRWLAPLLIAIGTLTMVSTRPAVWTVVITLFAAVAWHLWRGPGRLRHVMIALLVVGCVLAFRAVDPRRQRVRDASVIEERMSDLILNRPGFMLRRTLGENVPLMFEEVAAEGIFGARILPGVNSLLTLATIALGVLLMRERPLWGLLVGATVAQMLVHLPRERYFLPILPLLLYALWRAAVWLEARYPGRRGRAAFCAIVTLMLLPNAAIVLSDIGEQHRRPFLAHYERGRYVPLIELAKEMPAVVGERDVVIAAEDRVVSYFSRRKTLPPITARRWPPGEAEQRAYRDELVAAETLWVLLPGENVESLIAQLGLTLEPTPTLRKETRRGALELRRATFGPATSPPTGRPSSVPASPRAAVSR